MHSNIRSGAPRGGLDHLDLNAGRVYPVGMDELSSKNECAKTRPQSDPYEVWATPIGEYLVLKKYKSPKGEAADPYARWFTFCNGDLGDMYAADIKKFGWRIR